MKQPSDLTDVSHEITGEEIRQGRQDAGFTQEQLARIVGAHPTSVHRWESGTSPCELPGAVKYTLEYFKLRRLLLGSPVFERLILLDSGVFQDLENYFEETVRQSATLKRQRAHFEKQRAEIEADSKS